MLVRIILTLRSVIRAAQVSCAGLKQNQMMVSNRTNRLRCLANVVCSSAQISPQSDYVNTVKITAKPTLIENNGET
jgi:hypothetical protein